MIALNVRLAFSTSANYLTRALQQNPAAPTEIVNAVDRLATSYEKVVLAQIAVNDEAREAATADMDSAETDLKNVCR